jgi:hypothetical protein
VVDAIGWVTQFLLEFPQKAFLPVRAHVGDTHLVHAGSAGVGLHPSPGFLQDVETKYLIVE